MDQHDVSGSKPGEEIAKRFRSKAQWRWAFATDQSWARRWANETPGSSPGRFRRLPRYVRTSRSKENLARRQGNVRKETESGFEAGADFTSAPLHVEMVFEIDVQKGDYPGHPFRGNQYVRGRSAAAATAARDLPGGGFTIDPRSPSRVMRYGDAEVFIVATHPAANRQIPAEQLRTQGQRREAIAQYIRDNQGTIDQNPDVMIGGWLQTDDATGKQTVHLDLVSAFASKEQALAIGRKYNEIAIFDLKNGEDIAVTKGYALAHDDPRPAQSSSSDLGGEGRRGDQRLLRGDRTEPPARRGRNGGRGLRPLAKGDYPGHPFRGNQHVRISSASASAAASRPFSMSRTMESIAAGRPVTVDREHLPALFMLMDSRVRAERSRGEGGTVYDLKNLSIRGIPSDQQPFSGGNNLGLSRSEMPQVPRANNVKADFIAGLRSRGLVKDETVDPLTLKGIQREVNGANAGRVVRANLGGELSGDRIPVSREGYILDGHHRWAAAIAEGKPLDIYRVDLGVQDLIVAAKVMNFERNVPSRGISEVGPTTLKALIAANRRAGR